MFGFGVTLSRESGLLGGLLLCGFGCLVLFLGLYGFFGMNVSYWCVGLGCGLCCSGLVVLVWDCDVLEWFGRFEADVSGLGYQVILFIVGLGLFSFVWFALGWPAEVVTDMFLGLWVPSGLSAVALSFTQGVIRLLPVIVFVSHLLWLWVSAHRREEFY